MKIAEIEEVIIDAIKKARLLGYSIRQGGWVHDWDPKSCCPFGAVVLTKALLASVFDGGTYKSVVATFLGISLKEAGHFICGFDDIVSIGNEQDSFYILGKKFQKYIDMKPHEKRD